MDTSNLENLLRSKTLSRMAELTITDSEERAPTSKTVDPNVRNLCTKIPLWLFDDIDDVCASLKMKKRDFCEAAFIQAIEEARAVMEDIGLSNILDEKESIKEARKEIQEEIKL